MANKYWVGGTGNLDGVDTTHISDSSGGAGGATYPAVGDVLLLDAASGGGTVTVTNTVSLFGLDVGAFTGTFNTNGQTINCSQYINITGTGTRTVTLGASAINTNYWNAATITGLTFSSGTSNITCTSPLFGGLVYYDVTVNAVSGVHTPFGLSNTFRNLTWNAFTSPSNHWNEIRVTTNQTITNLLSMNGLNTAHRLALTGLFSFPTISAGSVSVSYFDIGSIVASGSASWDLSESVGFCGDLCLNSGIVTTSPVTLYWYQNSGDYADSSKWFLGSGGTGGAGRVPIAQDTVIIDSNSFTIPGQILTCTQKRIGRNIDWSAVSNYPQWNLTATNPNVYGNVVLGRNMSITGDQLNWTISSGSNASWTCNGQSIIGQLGVSIDGYTLTLMDDFYCTAGGFSIGISHGGGALVARGNVTMTGTFSSVTAGRNRSLYMGPGTWTINRSGGSMWNVSSNGLNALDPGTSTINISGNLTSTASFTGGGLTYYNLNNSTTGSFALQILDSNTFNNLHIDASSNARTIQFTAGTTTTLKSITRDAGSNVITIGSITAASHTLLKSGTGKISVNNMSISRSTATPSSTFYAYYSTDGGNNSGWNFVSITDASVASFSYSADSALSSWLLRTPASAAKFDLASLPAATSSTISLTASVASFLFGSLSAAAKGIARASGTAAAFVYSALSGTTTLINPDPRVINVTVSVSPNPAIVVSRSSYSITVSR